MLKNENMDFSNDHDYSSINKSYMIPKKITIKNYGKDKSDLVVPQPTEGLNSVRIKSNLRLPRATLPTISN